MLLYLSPTSRRFAIAASIVMTVAAPVQADVLAQTTETQPAKTAARKEVVTKLAVQISDNDPKTLNLALNNVRNVLDHYAQQKKSVAIEVVAYGPGLHMLRSDTSPVKDRVAELSLAFPNLRFSACRNTLGNMQRQEGREVSLVSEAKLTESGVVRLIDLQKQGYAYIRP